MTDDRSIYKYDPRLIPEREVKARVSAALAARRNTRYTGSLYGHWLMTCTCGSLWLTTDPRAADIFGRKHKDCS